MPTLIAAVVEASGLAAQTRSRFAKRDAIARCLRDAAGDEIEIAVAWLSGDTRQGRLGIGYATLAALRGAPAPQAALFERATAAERDFLLRLLVGELRQGALEGVMVDAIAAAAQLPVADVRRAALHAAQLARDAAPA